MIDERRDIAIVGMSAYTPAGNDIDELWEGLSRGGDFITETPPDVIEPYYFTGEPNGVDRFYCNRGGFCKAFRVDMLRYGILPIAADGADPDHLVAMAETEQALTDAGVFEKNISLDTCSIIIGKGTFSGLISLRVLELLRTSHQITAILKAALPDLTDDDLERIRIAYQKRLGRYHPDMATGTMPSLVASQVANRFDMHGAAYTLDAACASGILAIEHSIQRLRSGECDIAVAGGMHTGHSAPFWGPFDLLGALSHRGQIAPFSKDADGLLIGQGGGFLVLKTLRRALEDEDRIYALIKDTAVSSDGTGSHVLVTSVAGQLRVLKKAWERAGMDPRTIGYIEAHGTGTPAGDRVEAATLKEFFGDNTHPPALVGSIKSNIGHTMPAAGTISIIKTALALYHRQIPPTLHCEEPLAALLESRFLPPQELVDWEEDRYPLVAAVNAFGFGGVNSHAILTPYEPTAGMPAPIRPRHQPDSVLMISAPTREALVQKLQTEDFTHTGGTYRLVLFNPTNERIETAITIVEKDKPWRGRMGIWFSNAPLLANGGKIVYLCSGFGPDEWAEADSISDELELPLITELLSQEDDHERTQAMLRYYYLSWLCKEGLRKLGITPDLYAANSTGEWGAAMFAGITGGSPREVFGPLLSATIEYHPLIAVIGIDNKQAAQWCTEIPGLYLSNDNCPGEVLMSGTQDALDIMLQRLKEQHLFHTVLPYGSGMHTPLMKLPDNAHLDYLTNITIQKGEVPVWSSATLEPVPTNKKDYAELFKSQLTQPVHFRQLIEKLYDEQNARVFIQLGVGPSIKFIRETLKGREFSAIPSCVPERKGTDQLRQVLAALFVEGREIDARFLGVKSRYITEHSVTKLTRGARPIITEMPELTEIITARYGLTGPRASASNDTNSHPLLSTANANMRDAIDTQNEMIRLFEQLPKNVDENAATEKTPIIPPKRTRVKRDGTAQAFTHTHQPTDNVTATKLTPALPPNFEEIIRLTFEDHPYVADHSIIRQPRDWKHPEDLNIVIPLTMTIELLSEVALKHASGRMLIGLKNLSAYRWIEIEQPFEGTIRGAWKTPDLLELELVGYAKSEFILGDERPKPPAEYTGTLDIGEPIMKNRPVEELYDRYAFHGPYYRSNTAMLGICSRGMRSLAVRREGKGSLLDIMGQQLGLFLHLTQEKDVISFPVRIKELTFYADVFDQEGEFEHTMLITKLTENSITADMVLKREKTIWSVARGFVCQRFESNPLIWNVILKPQSTLLANKIAPGVYHFTNRNQGNMIHLLEKRYLNHVDNNALKAASTRQRREYLTSRIALKDAVRAFTRSAADDMLYPIEIFCAHDENGQPSVYGEPDAADALKNLCVSLAHKDDEAVAMVANYPIGIDVEKIEEKSQSFLEITFTKQERELLESLKQPEGITRFWVAKEACAKQAGTGLQGDPKRFEVSAIKGDMLYVGEQGVQTMTIGEEYVIGWTAKISS
jgi:acyl transferase domain-containing protein/phosphopantetheinyl transferase